MVPPRNNFDLIRFVLAFVVFLFHAHVLSGRQELSAFSLWLSADLAVKAFFVVSGFLVVMSFERSASVVDYARKRVRRIYPAYATVVCICAIGGLALSTAPAGSYFSGAWFRYLASNLVFLNFLAPQLPGVFLQNPWTVVNGALWSLKVEVMFYMAVPAIAWLCARGERRLVLIALYALSVVWAVTMDGLARETGRGLYAQLAIQLPGQLRYFLVGAASHYYGGDLLTRHWRSLVPVSLAALLLPLSSGVNTAVEPVALGALVVALAVGVPYAGNFGRYGDMSYGIYIVHFPVLQTLVAAGLFAAHPYLAVAVATVTVLGIAFASWHMVERPFLKASSHYVRAAGVG